jgi:uncharacterized membrane protein YfcA
MVVGLAPWWMGQTEWTSLLTVGAEQQQGRQLSWQSPPQGFCSHACKTLISDDKCVSIAKYTCKLKVIYWYCLPLAFFVCVVCTSSGFSGSVLFQPVFYFILKVPLSQSIATGIATETVGMSWGAINYMMVNKAATNIDFKAFRSVIPFVLAGVAAGYSFFIYAPKQMLRFAVGLIIALIAMNQIWLAGQNRLGDQQQADSHVLSRPLNRMYQFFSGAFSASTGTGVAEMSQPLLEEKAGLLTLKANATAILLEATADWAITAANLKVGNIRFDILVFTVTGVLLGGFVGPRIAPYLNPRITKLLFGLAVTSIGFIYMITSWPSVVAFFRTR